jgi:large subunit ribosomal protein L35
MKVKNKTRKSAAKRFRVTPKGKVLHRAQGFRHLRNVKGKRNLRRLKKQTALVGKFASKVKKMLGIK